MAFLLNQFENDHSGSFMRNYNFSAVIPPIPMVADSCQTVRGPRPDAHDLTADPGRGRGRLSVRRDGGAPFYEGGLPSREWILARIYETISVMMRNTENAF